MTSPGQLGQASEDSNEPPQEAHESLRHTRRRPAGRFSLPRNKRTWLWLILSLIVLAGVALFCWWKSSAISGCMSAAPGGAPAAPGSSKASQGNQAPNSGSKASRVNQTPNSSKAKGKVPSAAQVAEGGEAHSRPGEHAEPRRRLAVRPRGYPLGRRDAPVRGRPAGGGRPAVF